MTITLLVVLVFAKVWGAVANGASVSPLNAWAYLWQDALIVLAFAGLNAATRARGRWRWCAVTVFIAVVAYTAVYLGVLIASGAMLSVTMLRAAGGALTDSVTHYFAPRVLVPVAIVTTIGAFGPWLVGRRTPRHERDPRGRSLVWPVATLLAIAIAGYVLLPTVNTRGLHRSGPVALLMSVRPRLGGPSTDEPREWTASVLDGSAPATEPSALTAGSARGLNLVLVVLESVGAQYLAPYEATRDPMPFLTELAGRSFQAEYAYAVYPESIKGFVPLIASRYPAFETTPESYEFPMATLASVLKANGYQTALYHSGRFDYLGMRSVIEGRGFDTLVDAGQISGVLDSSFGVEESSTIERLLADLDRRTDDAPFFYAYLPIAGHHPYDSPERGPFDGEGEFSDYLNAIHYADRSIRTLYDGLHDRGLSERTLFVVVGDHGQAFAQHPGNYGHVFYLYEENIRIPLWIHGPGVKAERWRQPVSVIDLSPTITDLLGIEAPTEWQGRSWIDPPTQRVVLFFTDYSLGLVGARDQRWKLIHEIDSGRDELFDLSVDPRERVDRSADHPELTRKLREHTLEWARTRRAEHLDR